MKILSINVTETVDDQHLAFNLDGHFPEEAEVWFSCKGMKVDFDRDFIRVELPEGQMFGHPELQRLNAALSLAVKSADTVAEDAQALRGHAVHYVKQQTGLPTDEENDEED